METSAWQRYGAMGGFWFVVLAVVGTVAAGAPPSTTDSAAEILEYYEDSSGGIRAGAYLGVLAMLGLLFWVGSLWSTLRRAEGGAPRLTVVAGLGAAIGATCAGISFAIQSATALRADEIGAAGAKFFHVLGVTVISAGGAGIAALVLATSIISLRTKLFPAWLTGGGLLLGVLWLVAALAIATDRDAVGAFGFVCFILWSIWIISISVMMLRETPVEA
jgi:hypothetical protein